MSADENAYQDIIDRAVFQVYYRQLGTVALHFGVNTSFPACQYLADRSRGGKVSWVVPGAFGQWDGLQVTPGYSDSPLMSLWFFGSAYLQKNTVFVRKGFWTLYLPDKLANKVVSFSPSAHGTAPLGGKVVQRLSSKVKAPTRPLGRAPAPFPPAATVATQLAPATGDKGKALSEYNRMHFLKVY
jgi:hypothetical protein